MGLKRIAVLLVCLFTVLFASAQQEMQFSQFMLNPAAYNAGFVGTDQALSANLQVRNQWTGLPGHPVLQNFNIHTPLSFWNCGAGIFVNNEVDGALRNTEADLAFSKITAIGHSTFNIGIKAGILQSSLDGDKLRASEGHYSNGGINHNDDILPVNTVSSIIPDLSAGLSFRSRRFEAGVSANHVLGLSQDFKVNNDVLSYSGSRNFTGYASASFSMGRKVTMRPSVFAKYESPELQAEINSIFLYKKSFWLGAGYRGYGSGTNDGVIAFAGIYLNPNLSIGYSYDYSLSAIRTANNGSHELVLNYHLSLTKPYKVGKFIFTPRF